MSKSLEVLKKMYDYIMIDNEQGLMDEEEVEAINEDYNLIKQDLELKEHLEKENQELTEMLQLSNEYNAGFERVKADLMIENSKNKKVIKILKDKRVDLDIFINCVSLEGYNNAIEYTYKSISENYKLTQQEYDLLKEVFGNE